MKNSTRTPLLTPGGIFKLSPELSKRTGSLSALGKASSRFSFMALLAGLFLFLFSAPSAQAHSNPPGCTGSGLGILLFTDAPDVHIGDTLNYSVTVFNGTGVGPVVCDSTEIQAFIVTPDGVSHTITLVRTTLSNGQSDYYPNVVSYVVRAQDIRPDGTVRATASDTGVIHQNDTNSQGGGNQGVNTEVSQPCILLNVVCVGSVGETGAINFSGTVTNCGNNTLVNVTVTNFVNGQQIPVAFITNLTRGQIASFSGSWIPTNSCMPSTATFVAQGADQFTTLPRTVTSSANTTCGNVLTPGILVTKTCPTQPVAPGQLLTFSGSVSNIGNVTLTNIVVVNNQPAPNTSVFTLASLAPGAVANFTGSYTAPTNCSISDTLTATANSRCGTAVTSSATANCPILTTPQIAVTAVCSTGPVTPGGSVVYNGTVQNTGNITLTNVIVVSDRPSANTTVFSVATLAPGATANFTGTYTVPVGACAVTTTFRGTGRDICTLNTVTNSATAICSVGTAPSIVVTLVCPTTSVNTGALITYTGTVRNSGSVTLNNVTVVNNQSSPSTVFTVASLAPGVTANFTASFIAPTNVCSVSSTVTASGTDNCSSVLVTNTASATCTLNTAPALVVTQVCPTTPAIPGSTLTYTGSVSNSGNITLTNIIVLNNLSGATPIFTTATLAPGASANFSGSYLAPTNCTSTSTSTATGRSICGINVSNSASATCTILTTPQIVITTVCPTSPIFPGGSLVYNGTVRNSGDITLTNVVVTRAGTTVFTASTLAPGVITNFSTSFTVPADACSVTAIFSGTAKDICTLNSVTNIVSTTCIVTTAPAIAVTLACPTSPVSVGGLITYTGTVRNSGNVTLTNVVVVNNRTTPSAVLVVPILAPGAISNFTATFTAPLDACTVSSTVTATGSDKCSGVIVTNIASATCNLTTTPRIVVIQNCPVTPVSPGGTLTYSGSVSNSGNITLTNVVVVNSRTGTTPIFVAATLARGATANFTGSYVVPMNSGCSISSTVTASGRDICTMALVISSSTAICPLVTSPAIVVTQTCPDNVRQGEILTYSGTVSNAGNITLTNVVVISDRPAANTVIFTRATLLIGETASFTGSYKVPTNCCVVSSTVRASGQGCDGVIVTDSNTRTCTVITAPALVVTKICAPGVLEPGDLMTYSGTVSNAGNITLINVIVSSTQSSNNPTLLGPINLAPGEWANYSASYIVPADFCGTDTVTATGLDVCTFLPVTDSETSTCAVTTTPKILVTKNCPVSPTAKGDLFIYTGTVSNPGNVTLVNVYVVDNQPTNNTPVIGPITLAPGVSVNFTNSYIAPRCCCVVIDTLTARGQDRCTSTIVTSTATAVCPLLASPSLAISRVCPTSQVAVGGLYAYTGSITNTGDVVLTNVFVFSSKPSANTTLLGPIELAPGESKQFSGSYTVTAGSDPAADIVTVQGTDTCQANTVSAAANCYGPIDGVGTVRITSITATNGMATITWSATSGTTYTLQSKALMQDAWVNVPGDVIATDSNASKQHAIESNKNRFYRVMVAQE